MQYQWIMDVLGDLKSFAGRNGLPDLARQIDATLAVAASDISRIAGGPVLVFSNPMPLLSDGVAGAAD